MMPNTRSRASSHDDSAPTTSNIDRQSAINSQNLVDSAKEALAPRVREQQPINRTAYVPLFDNDIEDQRWDATHDRHGLSVDSAMVDDCGQFESLRKIDGCLLKPCYYNKYTSCLIENTPIEVLNGLLAVCDEYGNRHGRDSGLSNLAAGAIGTRVNTLAREIDYSVNRRDFTIDGIVFVKHKPIDFTISIWHDSDEMDYFRDTRVEFENRHGDSMLFQLFWSEMLELMFTMQATYPGTSTKNGEKTAKLLFAKISECTRWESSSSMESFVFPLKMPEFIDTESETESDSASDRDTDSESHSSASSVSSVSDGHIASGYEYHYTRQDLDEMVLDLVDNYRGEVLDTLATLCETLEDNLRFHELCCWHKGIMNIIATRIVSAANYDNVAYIRGGLCVLLKMVSINWGKQQARGKRKRTQKQQESSNKAGFLNDDPMAMVIDTDESDDSDTDMANESKEQGAAVTVTSTADAIEGAVEHLVNQTNILKQFPLLLQNRSKIVQNHTIRLMTQLFKYIPSNIKFTKSLQLNFKGFQDKKQ